MKIASPDSRQQQLNDQRVPTTGVYVDWSAAEQETHKTAYARGRCPRYLGELFMQHVGRGIIANRTGRSKGRICQILLLVRARSSLTSTCGTLGSSRSKRSQQHACFDVETKHCSDWFGSGKACCDKATQSSYKAGAQPKNDAGGLLSALQETGMFHRFRAHSQKCNAQLPGLEGLTERGSDSFSTWLPKLKQPND